MKKTRSDHLIEAADVLRKIVLEEYEDVPEMKTSKEIEAEEAKSRQDFINSLKDLKDEEVPAEMPEGGEEMGGEAMPEEGGEMEMPAEGEEMTSEAPAAEEAPAEEMEAEGEAEEAAPEGEEMAVEGEEDEMEEACRGKRGLREQEEGVDQQEKEAVKADQGMAPEGNVEVKSGPVDGDDLEVKKELDDADKVQESGVAGGIVGEQGSRHREMPYEEQQDAIEDAVQIEIEDEMDEMEISSGEEFDANPAEEVYEVEVGPAEEMAEESEEEESEEVKEMEQESAQLLKEFQKLESEMRQIMKSSIIQEDLEMADTYLDDLIEQVKTEGMPESVSTEFDVMDTEKQKPKNVNLGDEFSEIDIFKEDLEFFEEMEEESDVLGEKYKDDAETEEVTENEDGIDTQEEPGEGRNLEENQKKNYRELQDEEDYEEFEEWLRFGKDKE